MPQAEAGDNIGALLRGIAKDGIERGQVLAKPGTVHPHTHFKGHVYVLSEKEGGRSKPFVAGYRPQFYFRTTDVTGTIELPEGVEMCRPGDNVDMTVDPDHPRRSARLVCGSLSVRVAVPSVPASSPRFWANSLIR